jgi:hypothetical protein
MVKMEDYNKKNALKHEIYLYVIVNNGFYEAKQNNISLKIIKNWCNRIGFIYGQGLGQSAGEMLPFNRNVPLGHGPFKNLGNALDILVENIQNKQKADDILCGPNFPYIGWRFMATNFFWILKAKKNGLSKKDIIKKL